MQPNDLSRRSMIRNAAVGLGAGVVGATSSRNAGADESPRRHAVRPPREVWVASLCQHKLSANSPAEMAREMLRRMEEVLRYSS